MNWVKSSTIYSIYICVYIGKTLEALHMLQHLVYKLQMNTAATKLWTLHTMDSIVYVYMFIYIFTHTYTYMHVYGTIRTMSVNNRQRNAYLKRVSAFDIGMMWLVYDVIHR